MKRIIVSCIIATDMSKHSKYVAKLQRRVAATLKVAGGSLKNSGSDGTDSSETLKNSTAVDSLDI